MNARVRVQAIPALLAASFSVSTAGKLLAHDGPHGLASMQPEGFDEFSLEITEDGVTGMPESVEAGRYLVNVTGPASGEMGPSGVTFIQFPEGVTPESAYEDIMAANGDVPSWFAEATLGGGATIGEGEESWAIVDFTPGPWVVTTLFGTTLAVAFEVTGEFPSEVTEPEASTTIEVGEMMIHVVDGGLVAGDNVVTVKNIGAQIHFIDVQRAPDGATEDQVGALIDSFMTGTPVAGDDALAEEDFSMVAYIQELSPQRQLTVPLTLDAGTYFLACWVTDPETMMPHAMMGMWTLVNVE